MATPPTRLRRLPPLVLGLVRVDARRTASWIVVVATLAVIMLAPAARLPAAAGGGVLLSLAAVGSLLREPAGSDLLHARLAARLAWPLVAVAVGTGIATLVGRPADRAAVAAAVAAGAVTAAVVVATLKRLPPMGFVRGQFVEREPTSIGQSHLVGRSWGDAAAMASTLIAMAICYFLMPELAGWYAVLATSWFTLLAVPNATIVGGDQRLRGDLVAAGPGRPRVAGTPAAAMPTLAAYAAILGWPAAVAAIVARERAWGWSDPLVALLLLSGMAVVAAALVWVSAALRWRDDTTLAIVAAAHATAIVSVA